MMLAALARPPLARLLRTRRSLVAVAGWGTVALAFAVAARSTGSSHGTDRTLLDAYAPLVLPLLVYALVGAVVGARALSSAVAPLVAFGAPPARAAAVAILVAAVACAGFGAGLGAAASWLAHGSSDPPVLADAVASAYAGGLGGTAYAAFFTLGASFGKRGGGRLALLVVDWVLGSNDGSAAVFTPRGHVRNLFGGTPPMDLSERASAALLLAMAIGCAVIAVRRAR
jgi:hypothetical protein